jgi:hypothetical protein
LVCPFLHTHYSYLFCIIGDDHKLQPQLHSFSSDISKSLAEKNCEVKEMKMSEKLRILVNRLRHLKRRFFSNQNQHFVLFFDDFFPSEKLFGFLGINFLKSLRNDQKLLRKRRHHLRASIAVAIIFTILMMINLAVIVGEPDKFVETIETFACVSAYGFVLLKTFFLCLLKRDALKNILEKLELNFPHSSREQLQFGVHRHHLWLKNMYRVCSFLYIWVVVHFAYTALFLGFGSKLIIPMYFSLDPYQSWLYPIIFILQAWNLLIVTSLVLATDVFFCNLVGTTSMEFEVVAQKITRIDPENDEHADRKMSEIIETYNELIAVTNELEEIFSPILLVNVFAGIFILCATVFLLFVGIEQKFYLTYLIQFEFFYQTPLELYYMIKFGAGTLTVSLQLFSTCFFCEQLKS